MNAETLKRILDNAADAIREYKEGDRPPTNIAKKLMGLVEDSKANELNDTLKESVNALLREAFEVGLAGQPCTNCNGTGRCPICYGSGRL
jgi:hypothetical protein